MDTMITERKDSLRLKNIGADQVKEIVAEEKEKSKQAGRPKTMGRKKTAPQKEADGSKAKEPAAARKTASRPKTSAKTKKQLDKPDNGTAKNEKAPLGTAQKPKGRRQARKAQRPHRRKRLRPQ